MYEIYVGEAGNEQGHYIGATESLHAAKTMAGRERNKYGGDGWAVIRPDNGGEEIKVGRFKL